MRTTEDRAVAACHSLDPDRWRSLIDAALQRVASHFTRREPRSTARDFIVGLLSTLERKTSWSLAEHAGHTGPQKMQRLLRTARWDSEALLADVRTWVSEHLGHPEGILIPDETGFLKKGQHSVGVQRQYTGTAGRIENSQVAVFLAYTTAHGRALIDRRLYLPDRSWCAQTQRRQHAGVPDDVGFATKPHLAWDMIHAALQAGIPARWVTADEAYGRDPQLRAALRQHQVGYVLAVESNRHVLVNHGHTRIRVETLVNELKPAAWHAYSGGDGAKGPRTYLWAWVTIDHDANHWLLVRRNRTTGELAYYLCWSPTPVPLRTLVRVAASRWSVEECFQTAKTHVGLDHYQVRGWTPWHRFTALAILALAVLAVCAATDPRPDPAPAQQRRPGTTLTLAEIRRLINVLLYEPVRDLAHALHWSTWRRRHQDRARQAHYQRRLLTER